VKRLLLLLVVVVVVTAACGRGGGTERRDETRTGSTGPVPTTSGNPTAEPADGLVRVQTAFCHDYLPLLAFTLDVGLVTGGDAIGTKNEDEVLSLVDASRTVLRQTETVMTIYANSLADLGEEDASDAAARTAALTDDIVHASDGQTLAAAIDPTTIDAVLPSDYCQAFVSEEFGRGYFDGWLLNPKASDDAEYVRGYRLGRAEGWRADA
jgi:hypothetical protein